MAGKRKGRVKSKIDELPSEIRFVVDQMLANVTYSYQDISDYIATQGFEISRSSVFRYAQRTNNATQRIAEVQAQTRALVDAIKKNPELDYTEGTLQMIAGGLTQRIAGAQEEWDNMDLNKAVQSLIALSRAKGYKDKIYSELQTKVERALDAFKNQIFEEISDKEPKLAQRLMFFAEDFAESITKEE